MRFSEAPVTSEPTRIGLCLLDADERIAAHDAIFESIVGSGVGGGLLVGRPIAELLGQPVIGDASPVSIRMSQKTCLLARLPIPGLDHDGLTAVVITDVTGQSIVEDRLRESVQAFWSLVESAPVGLIVLDRQQRVTLWNSAAERLTGWTTEEILGKPYPLVPASDRKSFEELHARVMGGEGFTGVQAWRARKDGSPILLGISTAPVRAAGGDVVGAMALLSDLTQQHALEQQLQRSLRMEAVGRLAGGVAHDFNNLLTIILSNAHLMRRRIGEPQVLDHLAEVEACAARARDLTAQLMTFGQRNVVRHQATSVHATIKQAEALLRRACGDTIEIDLKLADERLDARIDPGQLDQILLNLVVNARDAMPSGGTITVSTRRTANAAPGAEASERGYVLLSIADIGVGMEPQIVPHIFEPFFTTKQPGGGTGIGLATVYGLVTQAGGSIDVRTTPGQGSEFRIWLPAVAGHADEMFRRQTAEQAHGLVLLVEDDDMVRRAIKALLETVGYEVLAVSNGADALTVCATGEVNPDVVLTDFYMPRMNGRQLADALAALRPDLPLVFMSGNLEDDVLRERIRTGQATYVAKPPDPDLLAEALKRAIGRKTSNDPPG